eukprot:7068304-Prymnesium_polylepis.2
MCSATESTSGLPVRVCCRKSARTRLESGPKRPEPMAMASSATPTAAATPSARPCSAPRKPAAPSAPPAPLVSAASPVVRRFSLSDKGAPLPAAALGAAAAPSDGAAGRGRGGARKRTALMQTKAASGSKCSSDESGVMPMTGTRVAPAVPSA